MAGKAVEIAIQILHIHRTMGHRLRAVHHDGNTVRVRHAHNFPNGVDRSQRVGHMRDGYDFRFVRNQFFQLFQTQFPIILKGQHLEHGATVFAQELPRHDVGVMLHLGNDDFIAGLDECSSKRRSHQVDGLRGPAREDDLVVVRRVDELLDRFAGHLELFRGLLAQEMHAAMDVAVYAFIIIRQSLNNRQRLLRGGGVIEIDQRFVVNRLFQYGKIVSIHFDDKLLIIGWF